MTEREPTYGAWSTCRCVPPCALQITAARQAARKHMTKRELTLSAEDGDSMLAEMEEQYGMLEHYAKDLEAHMRTHGCEHPSPYVEEETV